MKDRLRRPVALMAIMLVAAVMAAPAYAGGWCHEPPPPPEGQKCNSGRGNGSEGDASQLLTPGVDTGPGVTPTVDCDPGNSGGVNRGGD